MMVQFRWIKMSLFVILVLLFTEVTGQNSSFTVRVGNEVTLPCENVIKNQDRCDSTSWIASQSRGQTARELVTLGKISQTGISKDISDRLSVTANCSLVIKKVTVEDVGRYSCRQFISERQQGPDSLVYLSVINLEKQQYNDTVVLFCAVLTYEGCGHTVKWLYDDNKNDTEILDSACSSRVTFPTRLNQKSNYYELLKCNVTDNKRGQTLLCDVGPQSSCETTGSTGNNKNADTPTQQDLWWFIIVAVGLATLLIITVAVIRWKKTKGNRTQMDKNKRLSLNPAETPETSQHMADPEDGVSYASVSYRTTNSKALVCDKGDDEAVTYATVNNASSSFAEASADPSNLYATVNKPKK